MGMMAKELVFAIDCCLEGCLHMRRNGVSALCRLLEDGTLGGDSQWLELHLYALLEEGDPLIMGYLKEVANAGLLRDHFRDQILQKFCEVDKTIPDFRFSWKGGVLQQIYLPCN